MKQCLNELIAIKHTAGCEQSNTPYFYLEDIEGITEGLLSQLQSTQTEYNKPLGEWMMESAIRLMLADIDSLIPSQFTINNEITSICSSCAFTILSMPSTAEGTGIVIKNTSNSRFSTLYLDSLQVKVLATGDYNIKISDGEKEKVITQTFTSGVVKQMLNIKFETEKKKIFISIVEAGVELPAISCPQTSSGCGCGGSSTTKPIDIVISGYHGVETSIQYGFIPCVKVRCSYDSVICDMVHSSPRLFALALLYLTASKVFSENVISQRINQGANFDNEEKDKRADYYYALYRERLTGNPKKNVIGISQTLNANLSGVRDKCVSCISPLQVAWATG